jgi:hypothetical protein
MIHAAEPEAVQVRGAKLWPMSVEAYHVLGEAGVIPENTELLYGLVYRKTPKSPFHSFLLHRFLQRLQKLELRSLLVRAEQPLTLEPVLKFRTGTRHCGGEGNERGFSHGTPANSRVSG